MRSSSARLRRLEELERAVKRRGIALFPPILAPDEWEALAIEQQDRLVRETMEEFQIEESGA